MATTLSPRTEQSRADSQVCRPFCDRILDITRHPRRQSPGPGVPELDVLAQFAQAGERGAGGYVLWRNGHEAAQPQCRRLRDEVHQRVQFPDRRTTTARVAVQADLDEHVESA